MRNKQLTGRFVAIVMSHKADYRLTAHFSWFRKYLYSKIYVCQICVIGLNSLSPRASIEMVELDVIYLLW